MAAPPDKVQHLVVLMMSGRSFDHLLGALKAGNPRIDGLDGTEGNPDSTGAIVKVEPRAVFQGIEMMPGIRFADVDEQVFGTVAVPQRSATMQGFVTNYFQQVHDINKSHRVMHYFAPDKLPVLSTLAREFAVFNRWFSSVPGPPTCNHCRHPSIRTLCEGCAPGASWVFSFQPVLPPVSRPLFHLCG
ncbi:MAG: alkaline phosphatase family protein [Candidatus Sulfotelmatobacter sp.]